MVETLQRYCDFHIGIRGELGLIDSSSIKLFIRREWFFCVLVLFLSGFYWAPTTKSLNNIFYGMVLVPLFLSCFFVDLRIDKIRSFLVGYKFFLLFVGLMVFSSIYVSENADNFAKNMKGIIYVLGFLIAVNISSASFDRLGAKVLPWAALLISFTAMHKIFVWYSGHSFSVRLKGFGITDNPILLAVIYAAAGLIFLIIFLQSADKKSWFYLSVAGLCYVIVMFSQSRGPLLALGSATCLALLCYRGRRSLLVLFFIVAASLIFFLQYSESRVFSLGGVRIDIWRAVIDQVQSSPLLGFGLQQAEAVEVGGIRFIHPHSVYVTTLFHGGLLGLGGLLLMIASVFVVDIHDRELLPARILLCLGLIYMVFDGYRLFSHPEELWLIFWLPIGFLLARIRPKPAE